ncbi:multidrug efflux RND transporter permease subunit [Pseudogulbenkiania ferrooxidans]|uniref:Acriflavin resistance protein n=1 Tax=Pseudogulbenkiania ferrooxidans 2002 TaxID=279714 RepID=B9Z8Y6_9NEIS|nr:multidrug efflux RND transporter permease subunit [Pseudogulbenkiania ferrooxidans]EEG06805.1 acriflavin resistance protein [Pseudogulbenkiania ferrooxidans 2002]
MIPSAPFIRRPVATVLLTLAIALAGLLAFGLLPVASLPQVDFPTIQVQAQLAGASPETMAATVATPLERTLGRIAGVNEITSTSSQGSTRIVLQFDLNRDSNGAAKDVQGAINAALANLPSALSGTPTYRKVNPSEAPVLILTLTSDTLTKGRLYDIASTVLAQKLSQVDGIGQVTVGGGALPAVRVALDPTALSRHGVSFDAVRRAIQNYTLKLPLGVLEDAGRQWQLASNDQLNRAADYRGLIVHYQDGAALRLADVATVSDSVQDVRNAGLANGKPAIVLLLFRAPGANVIDTVERVRALMPQLSASVPQTATLTVTQDRTSTIRASLRDVERTLVTAVALVVLVVFLFLQSGRATLVPAITVPVSLIGTFGVMYLAGFSLNNLSLMALTIATGFVVDDTIVVLENIARHIENGMTPRAAAFRGAREVGFTVLAMSLSLIAVFIPILLMGDIVGRLFREFALTLSAAILVSLVVSLTTAPMLCSRWLRPRPPRPAAPSRFARWRAQWFERLVAGYRRSLAWSLDHHLLMLLLLVATVAANVALYVAVPKGFFPQQDTGRLIGNIRADQSISFQAMRGKLQRFVDVVRRDPAVASVVGFTGGGARNSANVFVGLKPRSERQESADQVIARLRKQLSREPGATLFLQAAQELRIGGRQSNAQYQYTLQGDDLAQLRAWEPRVRQALVRLPGLADVNTDQQDRGLQTTLLFDRDTLARLGLTQNDADSALGNAFGQRQIATLYNPLNQYKVVLEAAPAYLERPESLRDIYLITPQSQPVPLATVSRVQPDNTPLAVNHQGQFAATTVSFNLDPGVSIGAARAAIDGAVNRLGLPGSLVGSFQGSARAFQASLDSQPWLILAALAAVYIVLGILYESAIHPITILSTLPSAGVGAILALQLSGGELNVVAMIGVLLLIGIVKKNAIMLIDFALAAERKQGLAPREAILEAGVLRFRPILMTTMAALLGALPLALGHGEGAELRQPLGISVVGGLIVSQLLTLYTTPVVYLYMDRLRRWSGRRERRSAPAQAQENG